MAQLPIPYGAIPNDPNTANDIDHRTAFQRIQDNFSDLYALQSRTVNAGDVRFASQPTTEARIQAAITQAALELAGIVFVPANMLPYNPALITFNNAIRMVREGGDVWTAYDAQAYGAPANGVLDDGPAIQAAGAAAAANNGVLVLTAGANFKLATRVALTIGASFTLAADGATITSTVADTGQSVGIIELTGTSSSHIVLLGLTLNHTYMSGETLAGIRIGSTIDTLYCRELTVTGVPYYGADVTVSGSASFISCIWKNNRHAGLGQGGGCSVLILNNESSDNGPNDISSGYGLSLSGSNVKIIGGRYLNNDRMGIDLRRADNVVVDSAYVYNSGGWGIYGVNEDGEKDSGNIRVVNCTVDMNNRSGSQQAIWLGMFAGNGVKHFNEAVVVNNTIKNVLQQAVLISTGTGSFSVHKAVVNDNVMESIVGAAVNVGGTTILRDASVDGNILRDTGNIIAQNVANFLCRGNSRTLTSGNASNFIAATGDLYTEISGNVSNAVYTATPFTWQATRYVVRDNIAVFGPQDYEIRSAKAAIADNSATTFLSLTVPNIEIGGMLTIDYSINDEDKGDVYYRGQIVFQIARYPGVAVAISSPVYALAETTLSTGSGWGRTITTTFSSAVSGAAGATNTIAIKVTADVSDNLTSYMRYRARLLHGHKVGGAYDITMVPA